jgi:hypothetical protein
LSIMSGSLSADLIATGPGLAQSAGPAQPIAAALLQLAAEAVTAEYSADNWRASVARDLITCVADLVALLPKGDIQAAQELLGAARAAVGTATYAVRKLHDDARKESD